jgi:hypothetical protein
MEIGRNLICCNNNLLQLIFVKQKNRASREGKMTDWEEGNYNKKRKE